MQDQQSSASSTGSLRQLNSKRVQAILRACLIPQQGVNKLAVIGRGNSYRRDNGTQVRIFNVQAFASAGDAQESANHWIEGTKLENAGDIAGAQEHYKNALNKMMSFSVLEENAAPFEATLEVIGRVEEVDSKMSASGKTLGLNNVRPAQVEAKGSSAAGLFSLPKEVVDEKTPETSTTGAQGTPSAKVGARQNS
jgi:hypothetical protein